MNEIIVKAHTSIYAPKKKFMEALSGDFTHKEKEKLWKKFKHQMQREVQKTWNSWVRKTIRYNKWWKNSSGRMFEDVVSDAINSAEVKISGGRLVMNFSAVIKPSDVSAMESWNRGKEAWRLDLLRRTNAKYYSDFIRRKRRVQYQYDIWDSNVNKWSNDSVSMIAVGRDKRGTRAWIRKAKDSRYLASKWKGAGKAEDHKSKIINRFYKLTKEWDYIGEELFYQTIENMDWW
jgi:hypothetical protein